MVVVVRMQHVSPSAQKEHLGYCRSECSRLPLDSRRRPTLHCADDRHWARAVPYTAMLERGVRSLTPTM
jgi:hypothetical protein